VNPLTLMQSHQVSNLEALRAAQGVHELAVREAAQKRVFEDTLTLAQTEVPEIPNAEALRTEDKKQRDRRREREGEQGEAGEELAAGEPANPANPAESHLDLLA
jgi:hypothetical protein